MFIGGGLASTAGGVKVLRLLILLRMVRFWIGRTSLCRHAVVEPSLGERTLDEGEIRSALLLFALMITTVTLCWWGLMFYNLPPMASLFEVVSALGTVGLSTGLVSSELGLGPKLILMLAMLLGRLEIITLLVLLWSGTWIGRRRSGT
jgi:trk system potassium uptake protein TrkH